MLTLENSSGSWSEVVGSVAGDIFYPRSPGEVHTWQLHVCMAVTYMAVTHMFESFKLVARLE